MVEKADDSEHKPLKDLWRNGRLSVVLCRFNTVFKIVKLFTECVLIKNDSILD